MVKPVLLTAFFISILLACSHPSPAEAEKEKAAEELHGKWYCETYFRLLEQNKSVAVTDSVFDFYNALTIEVKALLSDNPSIEWASFEAGGDKLQVMYDTAIKRFKIVDSPFILEPESTLSFTIKNKDLVYRFRRYDGDNEVLFRNALVVGTYHEKASGKKYVFRSNGKAEGFETVYSDYKLYVYSGDFPQTLKVQVAGKPVYYRYSFNNHDLLLDSIDENQQSIGKRLELIKQPFR